MYTVEPAGGEPFPHAQIACLLFCDLPSGVGPGQCLIQAQADGRCVGKLIEAFGIRNRIGTHLRAAEGGKVPADAEVRANITG